MYGVVINTYANTINNAEGFASMAERWHKDADVVAGRSPRLAARMREIARAYADLAYLAASIKRESEAR